ncbi:MAG: hypothetical protein QW700_08235, partial [Desulfurococcaceae archaeon]
MSPVGDIDVGDPIDYDRHRVPSVLGENEYVAGERLNVMDVPDQVPLLGGGENATRCVTER